MSSDAPVSARQLWGAYTTPTSAVSSSRIWCTPLILPTGGVLVFGDNQTSTLSARATFKLPCESHDPILSPDTTGNSTVIGFSEPFYASLSPQVFALATATVISYILVILIFITPRTFYVGGPGGGSRFLSRSGLMTGSHGSSPIVGVGRRPLLQKIATVTVAISLTIAAADTFNVAQHQYHQGYSNSNEIVENVVNTLEIRIIRVISDTFLWLAQVQTLIRLFPRHKEKVTIKWLGFALVSFDVIFSILDSFVSDNTRTRPRSFEDAIPALNYLFELSISLIYASCVVYYSLSKRRFAFWHPKMRNVCLVALVSYISILIPVVFFVLDISLPRLAGWGEYIRWVGAAAASVVVWEWVERIEALERDERKDGILGREIFDGDEMLDITPSEDADWHGRSGTSKGDGDVEKNAAFRFGMKLAAARAKIPLRRRRKRPAEQDLSVNDVTATGAKTMATGPNLITVPQTVGSPPSRSDTASAASTVYAIRYHNLTSPSPGVPDCLQDASAQPTPPEIPKEVNDSPYESAHSNAGKEAAQAKPGNPPQSQNQTASNVKQFWQTMANPFKRRRAEPPAEVAGAQIASGMRRSPIDRAMNLRDRVEAFATAQKERFGGRNASIHAASLPVTVIPAPKVNERTWSPDDARHVSMASEGESQTGGERTVAPAPAEGLADTSTSAADKVVFIPAPIEGRTWSPPDQHDPNKSNSQTNSANSRRSKDDATPPSDSGVPTSTPPARTSTNSPRNSTLAHTTRGTLMISEDASRLQLPPPTQAAGGPPSRRSTSARPVSISPISERLGVDLPAGMLSAAMRQQQAGSKTTGEPIASSSAMSGEGPSASLQLGAGVPYSPQTPQSTPHLSSISRSTRVETREQDEGDGATVPQPDQSPQDLRESDATMVRERQKPAGTRSPGDNRDSGGTA